METPIAFFIFRRPVETKRVFEAIRKIRPKKLFVVADGGRNEEEWKKCNEARKVIESADWPCEVKRNYADKNLGCKVRVSSGLDWVFQNTDRAIILEDDTLPHESFFPFAEGLLRRYKNDERVMHIAGVNFQRGNPRFRPVASYYFSRMPQIWGWASWARAWQSYDVSIARWPEAKHSGALKDIFSDSVAVDYWTYRFDEVYARRNDPSKDAWDAQWALACFLRNGFAINPSRNLVTNIGGGEDATREVGEKARRLVGMPLESMAFPLVHPAEIKVNESADSHTRAVVWGIRSTFARRFHLLIKFSFPGVYGLLKKLAGK